MAELPANSSGAFEQAAFEDAGEAHAREETAAAPSTWLADAAAAFTSWVYTVLVSLVARVHMAAASTAGWLHAAATSAGAWLHGAAASAAGWLLAASASAAAWLHASATSAVAALQIVAATTAAQLHGAVAACAAWLHTAAASLTAWLHGAAASVAAWLHTAAASLTAWLHGAAASVAAWLHTAAAIILGWMRLAAAALVSSLAWLRAVIAAVPLRGWVALAIVLMLALMLFAWSRYSRLRHCVCIVGVTHRSDFPVLIYGSLIAGQVDLTVVDTGLFGPPPGHGAAGDNHPGVLPFGHPIIAIENRADPPERLAVVIRDHCNRMRVALNRYAAAGGDATGNIHAIALGSMRMPNWGRRTTLAVRFTSTRAAIQQIMAALTTPVAGLDDILVGHTWKDLNAGQHW